MALPSFESNFFGTCGIVAAACLFLSPVPTCYRIVKQRNTERFSVLPYLAQTVESSWWMLWAIASGNRFEMLLNNAVGASINLVYVLIFVVLAAREWRTTIWLQCAVGGLLIGLGGVVALTVEDPDTTFGVAAVTLNTIKYASPLAAARDVIKTRSVEFMPLPLTLAAFACSVFWGLHGLFLQDPFIYGPNCAGVAFATLQACLYIRYGCCAPKMALENAEAPLAAAGPTLEEQDLEAHVALEPPAANTLVDAGKVVTVAPIPEASLDEKDSAETQSEVSGPLSEESLSASSQSAHPQNA